MECKNILEFREPNGIKYGTFDVEIINEDDLSDKDGKFIDCFNHCCENSLKILELIRIKLLKSDDLISYCEQWSIDIDKITIETFYFNKFLVIFFIKFNSLLTKETEFMKTQEEKLEKMLSNENNNFEVEYKNNFPSSKITEKIYLEFRKKIQFVKELFDSKEKNYCPSICSYIMLIKYIIKFQERVSSSLKKEIDFTDKNSSEILKIFSDLRNFEVCEILLFGLYNLSSENVFNQSEYQSELWKTMKEKYYRISKFPKEELKEKLDKISEMINLAYASISKVFEKEVESETLMKAKTGWYMAYYFIFKGKAQKQLMKYFMNPKEAISTKVWTMLDRKDVLSAMKIILPRIEYCQKFYLKRTEDPITIAEIEKLTQKNIESIKFIQMVDISGLNNSTKLFFKKFPDKATKAKLKSKYVKVKLIHNSEVKLMNEDTKSFSLFSCCIPKKIENSNRNSLIIHVHGGGFVAMSPTSHETYTRKWAKELGIPILSIDYRLSPQFAFPDALDDVYQVYMWIIKFGEGIFDMKISNIILVGDSAGGNLCLSLTEILIIKGIKLPKALILPYPATKLSMNTLSLSYLNSLNDPILNYPLLKYCLDSYRQGKVEETNPFLSPLYMKDLVMQNLPPVYIIGGSSDPLRDDYVEFYSRLVKNKVQSELYEIKYFPHAFLNYDIPLMFSEANIGSEIIISIINSFINE